MKVIYIPVVIPVNIRTFFALVGCFIASLLIIGGIASQSWMLVEMRATNGSASGSRFTRIVGYQGLQFVDVYYCTRSLYYQGDFCDAQHIVYAQCDDATDAWCRGRVGFLITFVCGIVAALVALCSIGVGLVREMRHGLVSLIAAAAAIGGCVAYAGAYATAMRGGLLDSIEESARSEDLINHMGYGFYCYTFGTCILFISAITSASLYVCAPHGKENRARNAPPVTIVHMDAASTTQLAHHAPAPGFVQLSSDGRFALDDIEEMDQEEEELQVVPPVRPTTATTAAVPATSNSEAGTTQLNPSMIASSLTTNAVDVSPMKRRNTLTMDEVVTPEMAAQKGDTTEHET